MLQHATTATTSDREAAWKARALQLAEARHLTGRARLWEQGVLRNFYGVPSRLLGGRVDRGGGEGARPRLLHVSRGDAALPLWTCRCGVKGHCPARAGYPAPGH